VAGHSAGRDLFLRSADGALITSHCAQAGDPTGAGIVIIPDGRGYSNFYQQLAHRFAQAGIDALTIDPFSRWAGHPPDYKTQIQVETIDADIAVAREYIRSSDGAGVKTVFSVGFCFAGAVSWRQARNGFDGAIGFYGSGSELREVVPDLTELSSPLLLLVAGRDRVFPLDESLLLDRQLKEAGVNHHTFVYEEAPHSFFREGATWRVEAEDAWIRVLTFISEISSRSPG
jgi:carboxymethylenebutenolidase